MDKATSMAHGNIASLLAPSPASTCLPRLVVQWLPDKSTRSYCLPMSKWASTTEGTYLQFDQNNKFGGKIGGLPVSGSYSFDMAHYRGA